MKPTPIRENVERVLRGASSVQRRLKSLTSTPSAPRVAPVPPSVTAPSTPASTTSSPWAIASAFATKDGMPCGSKMNPYSMVYRGGKCVPNPKPPTFTIGIPVGERPAGTPPVVIPETIPGGGIMGREILLRELQESGGLSTPPTASSTTQAILSASSGGQIMPMNPIPSGPPSMPSVEEQVVAQANGQEIVAKREGGGGTMLVGAGAGFVVGGPVGAIIGAIIASAMSKPKTQPVAGFDGFFRNLGRAAAGVARTVTQPIRAVGRQIDASSPRSFIGRTIGSTGRSFVRQAVATSAAVVTGGASVLAAERRVIPRSVFGVQPTVQGFQTGAVVGAAILAGKTALQASKSVLTTSPAGETSEEGLAAIEAQLAAEEQVAAGQTARAPGAKSGLGVAAAGAGAGFLLGGPPGAVVGAIAGMLIGRR